ncbi:MULTISPECIES: hypothetical protein [unclassified Bradyrhizobium]|uniref:hypothetical protein n=1 Tax=unclassified Bradyrhizobium TaxID=2631580 RepID=UPI00291685F3|nr:MULTISPECIES: hypothetical protein [unclassified Bradyrhizobium]
MAHFEQAALSGQTAGNLFLDLLPVLGRLFPFNSQGLRVARHLGVFAGQLLLKALARLDEKGRRELPVRRVKERNIAALGR